MLHQPLTPRAPGLLFLACTVSVGWVATERLGQRCDGKTVDQAPHSQPKPPPHVVKLTTTPPGVAVRLELRDEERDIGETPLRIELSAEDVRDGFMLRLAEPGYMPVLIPFEAEHFEIADNVLSIELHEEMQLTWL